MPSVGNVILMYDNSEEDEEKERANPLLIHRLISLGLSCPVRISFDVAFG